VWVKVPSQDSHCVVVLNQNGESLEEEGAVAVVICALCDALLLVLLLLILLLTLFLYLVESLADFVLCMDVCS